MKTNRRAAHLVVCAVITAGLALTSRSTVAEERALHPQVSPPSDTLTVGTFRIAATEKTPCDKAHQGVFRYTPAEGPQLCHHSRWVDIVLNMGAQ